MLGTELGASCASSRCSTTEPLPPPQTDLQQNKEATGGWHPHQVKPGCLVTENPDSHASKLNSGSRVRPDLPSMVFLKVLLQVPTYLSCLVLLVLPDSAFFFFLKEEYHCNSVVMLQALASWCSAQLGFSANEKNSTTTTPPQTQARGRRGMFGPSRAKVLPKLSWQRGAVTQLQSTPIACKGFWFILLQFPLKDLRKK